MSVTIKDVAKKAGVSPSTVSRVIAEHPRISLETSRKVKEIMEELGYHPNLMAKSLVSRTTRTIAVILPKPAEELLLNFFFYELIRGVLAQLTRAGYDLLMAGGSNEQEELETVTRLVRGVESMDCCCFIPVPPIPSSLSCAKKRFLSLS